MVVATLFLIDRYSACGINQKAIQRLWHNWFRTSSLLSTSRYLDAFACVVPVCPDRSATACQQVCYKLLWQSCSNAVFNRPVASCCDRAAAMLSQSRYIYRVITSVPTFLCACSASYRMHASHWMTARFNCSRNLPSTRSWSFSVQSLEKKWVQENLSFRSVYDGQFQFCTYLLCDAVFNRHVARCWHRAAAMLFSTTCDRSVASRGKRFMKLRVSTILNKKDPAKQVAKFRL